MTNPEQIKPHKRTIAVWVLVLLSILGIGLLLLQVIDTEVLGFIHDDGVYAITAQALAQGKGFSIPSLPGGMPQVKYPLLYPLLLAPIWWLQPAFPQNLWLMNALSVGFAMAALGVLFAYLRRVHRFPVWVAWLALLLVSGNFYNQFFFSTVMSEAPYLFLTLLALLVAEAVYQPSPTRKNLLWVVVLSVLSFHARVTGLALILAIGVWLVSLRQYRHALLYVLLSSLFSIIPWYAWIKFNTPMEITALNFPLINPYSNYTLEFAHNFQNAGFYLNGILNSFGQLVSNLLESLFPVIPNFFKVFPQLKPFQDNIALGLTVLLSTLIATYALLGYYLAQLIRLGRQMLQQKALSGLSPAALYLGIYLLMIVLWNYDDQIYRFLVVISPLLWLYLLKPLLSRLSAPQARIRQLTTAIILLLAGVSFVSAPGSYSAIRSFRTEHWVESGQAPWLWEDYKATFAFIQAHLPPNATLAASNDVVFYLYTGHPTYYANLASLQKDGKVFTEDSYKAILPSMQHYGVQYLVVEPYMSSRVIKAPRNLVAAYLLQTYPERFKAVYQSPQGSISIYRILSEP